MKISIITLSLLLLINVSTCQSKYSPGFNFALFKNTPLFEFSKAVEIEDTIKMGEIAQNQKLDLDYHELKFGSTLLELALINNKGYAFQKLLNLGSNPNSKSFKDGGTPFLTFCKYSSHLSNSLNILKILIHYGADVNARQILNQEINGYKFSSTSSALQYLCRFGSVDLVMILVKNEVKLNIYPRDGKNSIIYEATFNNRLDLLRYLLINKKVPIPNYCVIRQEGSKYEKKISLRQLLYERKQFKDSNQQFLENEILNFLKKNGF